MLFFWRVSERWTTTTASRRLRVRLSVVDVVLEATSLAMTMPDVRESPLPLRLMVRIGSSPFSCFTESTDPSRSTDLTCGLAEMHEAMMAAETASKLAPLISMASLGFVPFSWSTSMSDPSNTSSRVRLVVIATRSSSALSTSTPAVDASTVSLLSVGGLDAIHLITALAWAPPSCSSQPERSTTLSCSGATKGNEASRFPAVSPPRTEARSTERFTLSASSTASRKRTSITNRSGGSARISFISSCTTCAAFLLATVSLPVRTSTAICALRSAMIFLR
mmetsp:Transcript_25698/g.51603  ORF Transcript_25698/g.51603 Transcript_25698/m.51603 type:complete len:279 (-) Transcript_25698:632-1468(-)